MVDFSKKIYNTNKFRSPALSFLATGAYCNYPKGTSEYFSFWETEMDRCINGFTADDGDYITGYNYFYLNYCPIQRIIYKITKDAKGHDVVKKTRETAFPDFYDYDYYYFLSIEEAENQGKHLCVAKARRKGFEQPESEEVLTPNGFVTMGSLKVGDFVMNPDGRACKVIEINEQGEQEVYEVELQDGRKVRCGENHLWSTINSTRGKLHIKTTKEYSKLKLKQGSKGKEFYPYKLPSVRPIDFEQPPGKIDPYVLGVLLGDGYICGSQIKFSTDDIFIVEELSKRLPNYTIKPLTDKFQYVIISNQKGIHELGRELKTLGLRVKADKKFIPLEYKLAPIEYRMELLQGLMDTDGSCTNGASTFVSTSEQLVDDVAFLCRSLGIRCKKSNEIPGRSNVDFGNGNFSNTLPHWELTIITEENVFKLPRKLEKLRHDRTYKYNAIGLKSIKSLGYKEKQRCIIVDHDNSLYLTKDFIPTHNSYKGGAMLCRNFFLIPNSKSYVYAANKQYLTEDGILTKAWDYMDFIDGNTAWGKKRQVSNTAMRRRASMLVTDDYGNKVEIGYKSEIMGVSIKDNPDSVRGKAGKLILWEEAGSNNQLEAAWQIARPSVEQDGVAFGLMIMFGTGGDEGDNVAGLRNAFYDPKAFNCIEFDNIWDEGAQGGKPCGFFVPQHTNLDIRDENGKRLYMDEDGNTLHEKAREFILNLREEELKSAKSSQQVDRYCAEHCLDKNTWISTEDGVSRIKDNPKAWMTGIRKIYEVTTEDGTKVLATDNHPFFNGEKYICLRDLKVGDTIKYYNTIFSTEYQYVEIPGLIPATNFKLKIDEDWAKFIGLFLGDGSFYGKQGKISVIFDKKDISSFKWCSEFIIKNFGNATVSDSGKNKGAWELNVTRINSTNVFKALDLIKSSSSGTLKRYVHVPEYIMKSPKSVVAAFLSGLFDSDGFSTKDGTRIGFFSKNIELLYDMQFLLRGFDIHAKISSRQQKNGNGYVYTENKLNLHKIDIPVFREQIGFLSDRKNNNIELSSAVRKTKDYHYSKITSIEYIKEDEAWDIETSTHALSANGIWVHNSETPAEAFTELSGNIFPKKELQKQLAKIRTNKKLANAKQVGYLTEVKGEIVWNISKNKNDIKEFPLPKTADPTGAVVIWEHPVKDAPFGLYVAGIDPYDQDQSGTNSLGCCLIYKRFQDFESYQDVIVAEYTGRPKTAEEFYENVRKLLKYYNAKAMVENQNTGIFTYFNNKHCNYLLADQPDIIRDITNSSKVNRGKGCHMTKEIKAWGIDRIKEWLEEDLGNDTLRLNTIMSEPLLEELIKYNEKINVDRVMALLQIMIYKEQLYNYQVKQKTEKEKQIRLFNAPLFKNYDNTYEPQINNSFSTTTYMFTN